MADVENNPTGDEAEEADQIEGKGPAEALTKESPNEEEHDPESGYQRIKDDEPHEEEGICKEDELDLHIESADTLFREQYEPEHPMTRIWDGVIREEHFQLMLLATEIRNQKDLVQDLKDEIDDKLTKQFLTSCEEREIKYLKMKYSEENLKLLAMMRSAVELQFDECVEDDKVPKRETTIEEDLAAAKLLRDLCASCKVDTCSQVEKRPNNDNCKKCGSKIKGSSNKSKQIKHLEKIINHMEKSLNSCREKLNGLKNRV